MRTTLRSSASALSAIAAALALSSTPALAQDASSAPIDGPIVNVPTTTSSAPAPAAPEPVIVLPDVSSPAPATTSTTTSTTPALPATRSTATAAPRTSASPATTSTSTRTAAPVRAPAPASDPVPSTPVSSSDAAPVAAPEPIAVAQPVEIAPVAADAAPEASPTPGQTRDVTGMLALALIGLIGLAVAGFALLAFRRRPKQAYRATPAVEKTFVPHRPAVAETFAPIAPAMPVAAAPAFASSEPLATAGAAVPLPPELPQTYEERDALLKAMVAAKPDRANPFHSYRARVHRARLILQSLGRKFENTRPWIDLSQYSRNWPALARRPAYQTA